MSFNNFVTETFILPFSDLLTGQSIARHLRFLNKSQYWTRDQIEAYQDDKLRDLISHVYHNVPFYREIFNDLNLKPEDIQSRKDLVKLPIITKEDLRKNKSKHLAVNLNKKNLIYMSSSGSTGEPFQFYVTRHADSFSKAAAIRAWYWMGYRLGDRYVKVSMNARSSRLKKIQDKLNMSLYLSSTQLTYDKFINIKEQITKYNPLFIRCYPLPLNFLSEIIAGTDGNYRGNNLLAINTTGSTLHDDIRNKIERVFNVNIYDSYSCEGGTHFSECPGRHYYHPAEEYAISELIEDEFSISSGDHPLRHITTDLHNYASPFIRYDTQDYIVPGDNQLCSCGRHFMNIRKIKGRDSDILITPSGKYLIVENFVAYFEWIPEVDQIQVVQEELNTIIIKMIVNDGFNHDVRQKIQHYWNEYIGEDVTVILEIADEIKLTPAGKRRTVIRNPKISIRG
jgi:phenylacetate-CoA ligase